MCAEYKIVGTYDNITYRRIVYTYYRIFMTFCIISITDGHNTVLTFSVLLLFFFYVLFIHYFLYVCVVPVRYTPLVYCSFHVVLCKRTADVAVEM